MNMKPSISYFLPTLDLGGTEKQVLELASGLRERGYNVRIIAVFKEGRLGDEVRKRGIPFVCLNAEAGWSGATFFKILKWIKAHQTDVLHTYLFGFHLFPGLPAQFLKIPLILSSRRDVDLFQSTKVLWMENSGNLFVDRVVCNSNAVEKWVRGREWVPRGKVCTIYNGVDLDRFRPTGGTELIRREFGIPQDAPLIGTVANFSLKKGYIYLLEAARAILEKRPDAWFLRRSSAASANAFPSLSGIRIPS